ncbi:MAG: proline--tRNA ligase, partial [Nitrosotalea sp.]
MSKEIGITAKKNENFSEWYTQVVLKAHLADYAPVKGLIVLRPYGYSIWESLKSSLDQKLKATGHENGFLPVLIPESLLSKESDHFAGFTPEVFWVTHSGETEIGDKLALRPTSEALAYSMYSKWIKSWRDLPLKINFWNTALRAEIKATKPFLRTSEFLWQEGHTVHTTKEEAEQEVTSILEMYKKTVEEELAIPVITGKKSEKEKFVGAVYTTTMESIMPDGKALQMGTSHFLGQNFSKPFDVKFLDKQNVETFAWQTSWGVSWRLIGALIMIHGDDKGLVLPPRVAPIQVVIVPIYYSPQDMELVLSKAAEIKQVLAKHNLRVHMDARDEVTPGYKFHDWEMKGVPLRIDIGPKDIAKGKMVLVR